MAVALQDIQTIPPFDCLDTNGIAARWKRWLRAFELYAGGKGVTQNQQKKSLLLHSAGMNVQDIFFTLPEGAGDNVYVKAVDALNSYFNPQSNVPFERHKFRCTTQNQGETIEQFIVRLRQKAETCEFGDDAAAVEEQIRDQVIEKCRQHELRRKLLQKGRDLTLQQLRDIAKAFEDSEQQATSIEGAALELNKISFKEKQSYTKKKASNYNKKYEDMICYSCGLKGHVSKDPNCPAKGKQCRKCKGMNHFQKMCKTKTVKESRKEGKRDVNRKKKVRHIQCEETTESESDQEEYTFVITDENDSTSSKITVQVGGVSLNMLIDSGASCNIVDKHTWDKLKEQKIKCKTRKISRNIYAYGSSKPLPVAGTFRADIGINENELKHVEFIVIEGKGSSLLGRDTALKLGVLKLGPEVNIINSSTTNEQIFKKYSKCFEGFGKLKDFQLKIPIDKNVDPVIQNLRRVPFSLRDKLSDKLDELEKLDIIEKVNEPCDWISPVVIAPKPNGDIRLCVDMRQANQAVKRIHHPIPTIDELLQDMNESKIFSKIDIQWAYHQIELEPDSREITAFITHKGLYRYKRLNFGISCAVEMFQKVIQQILQGCEGVQNILDDIIIHASTQKEHDERLHKVLTVLQEKGITLNRAKCEFNLPKLEFMGHVLSEHGVGPTEAKVTAVLNAREPMNASEVRSFLGLVQYSARFIPDLATLSAPLRKLTRKNTVFKWGQDEQNSFEQLKKYLAKAETLGYFNKSAPTQVIADASPVGLGCVLTQKQGDEYRVISYASRSLSDTERRYSQTEKEALSLVWGCERFHAYLYGTDFELLTDHKPLSFIFTPKSKPCARIERWILRLQPYKFKVRYIAGRKNISDSLSRLLSKSDQAKNFQSHESVESDEYVKFVARESTPIAMTTREIEKASHKDPELMAVQECLLNGKWYKLPYKEYLPVQNELSAIGKLVLRGTRIVIPKSLRQQILQLGHDGHPGIVSMKRRLRTVAWWPAIDKEIEKFCKSCYGCQLVSQPTKPEPMVRTDLPSGPWKHLSADLLGVLPDGNSVFVLVDLYSRFFEIAIMKNTAAEKITTQMWKMFVTHGIPDLIQTDNGSQFLSDHFQNFMRELGITHRRISPYWSPAQGQVERENRSILKRIRIAQSQKRDWKADLDNYLLMYRSTPHSTTGVSPAEMLFGRKIKTKLPQLQDYSLDDQEIRDRDAEQKEKGKIYSDVRRNAQPSNIKSGDTVLLKQKAENKFSTNFKPQPFTVLNKTGNSVLVESDQGVRYRRNVTHMRKFHDREAPSESETFAGNDIPSTEPESEPLPTLTTPALNDQNNVDVPLTKSVKYNTRSAGERRMPEKFKDFVMK